MRHRLQAPFLSSKALTTVRAKAQRDEHSLRGLFEVVDVERHELARRKAPAKPRRMTAWLRRALDGGEGVRLKKPERRRYGRPGVRVIAKQFGVNPGTVQRISRPFVAGIGVA